MADYAKRALWKKVLGEGCEGGSATAVRAGLVKRTTWTLKNTRPAARGTHAHHREADCKALKPDDKTGFRPERFHLSEEIFTNFHVSYARIEFL